MEITLQAVVSADLEEPLETQHPRDIRAMQIHIHQADLGSCFGKGYRQVGSNARFAHTTLATHDKKLVLDDAQRSVDELVRDIRRWPLLLTPATTLRRAGLTFFCFAH
jgi:hypothetical protein